MKNLKITKEITDFVLDGGIFFIVGIFLLLLISFLIFFHHLGVVVRVFKYVFIVFLLGTALYNLKIKDED